MNKKQLLTIGLVAGALAVSGAYGISSARAAETDTLPPMMQRLSERFGLNQDEVKTFMNEDREAHRAEMQATRKADFETKLSELVAAGTITEDQKAGIIAKHEELDTKRDAIHEQDLTRDEMHTQMESNRTEMTDYLKSIGLSEDVLPQKGPRGGQGGMGGFGGGRGMHRNQ